MVDVLKEGMKNKQKPNRNKPKKNMRTSPKVPKEIKGIINGTISAASHPHNFVYAYLVVLFSLFHKIETADSACLFLVS